MSVERQLNERNREMKAMYAPDDFREIIQKRLAEEPTPKKTGWISSSPWIKIAAVFIILLFTIASSDTLAYYGMRLFGYDVILSDTLQELNSLGKGQALDFHHEFRDGVVVDMEGLMLDDNNMIVYYRFSGMPVGEMEGSMDWPNLYFVGLGSPKPNHGIGSFKEEEGVFHWVSYYDPPGIFVRDLNFQWTYKQEMVEGTVPLDRKKAMGRTLKKNLNTSVEAGRVDVTLDSITASPTSTYIEGNLQNLFQLGWDVLQETRIRPQELEMVLLADGRPVAPMSSSMSTDLKGIHFGFHYDVLPTNFTRLEIRLERLVADYDVEEELTISEGMESKRIQVHGQDLEISDVVVEGGWTKVKLQTEPSVVLTLVHLSQGEDHLALSRTEMLDHKDIPDGEEVKTRILYFEGEMTSGTMHIQKITHAVPIEKTIPIL